jgi:predicted HicB family RNase H-like nuclease
MADKTRELIIEVPAEIRQAIERAAAAQDISISEFVERALAKFLADTGYIDEETAN